MEEKTNEQINEKLEELNEKIDNMNKRPKKNNTILYVMLVLLIGISVFLGYELLKKNDNEKINKDNETGELEGNGEGFVYDENDILEEINFYGSYKYTTTGEAHNIKKGDIITFYKYNQKTSEFKCNYEDCDVQVNRGTFTIANPENTFEHRYAIISYCETGKCSFIDTYAGAAFYKGSDYLEKGLGTIELFDVETGKSIKIENVTALHDRDDNFVYLTLNENEEYAVSYNGKVNRKIEKPLLYCWEGCGIPNYAVNYRDNLLVTIRNDKYGIEQLSTGNVIIEHTYDLIHLSNNGHEHECYRRDIFVGEKDGKQNFYRIKDNIPVLKNEYEKLFLISEDKFIAYKDKYLYIKNMNEEDLITSPLYVEDISQTGPHNPHGISTLLTEDKNIIEFAFYDKEKNDYTRYRFNIVTNELKKTN